MNSLPHLVPVTLIDAQGNALFWTYTLSPDATIIETGSFGALADKTETAVIGNVTLSGDAWRDLDDDQPLQRKVFEMAYYASAIYRLLTNATQLSLNNGKYSRIEQVSESAIYEICKRMILKEMSISHESNSNHDHVATIIEVSTNAKTELTFQQLIDALRTHNLKVKS